MFGQLLPNKNKIATVWRDTYYTKFGSKIWNLNMAILGTRVTLARPYSIFWGRDKKNLIRTPTES
jgi:hypothetical protein